MEDDQIVELYWQKNADAISETADKYGAYCFSIAENILHNTEDSEECVNDTWLHARNAIPPQKPNALRMFLAKITRNLLCVIYSEVLLFCFIFHQLIVFAVQENVLRI